MVGEKREEEPNRKMGEGEGEGEPSRKVGEGEGEGEPSRKMEEGEGDGEEDGEPRRKMGEGEGDRGLTCWQTVKNFFALTKPEATPLKWSTIMVALAGLVRVTNFSHI